MKRSNPLTGPPGCLLLLWGMRKEEDERGRVVFVLTQSHIVEVADGKRATATPSPPTHTHEPVATDDRQVLSSQTLELLEEEQDGEDRGLLWSNSPHCETGLCFESEGKNSIE